MLTQPRRLCAALTLQQPSPPPPRRLLATSARSFTTSNTMQKTLSGFFSKSDTTASPTKPATATATAAAASSTDGGLPAKRTKLREVGDTFEPTTTTQQQNVTEQQPLPENVQKNKTEALVKRLSAQLKEPSWKEALAPEFSKPYIRTLVSFLDEQRTRGSIIFPPEPMTFTALNLCPLPEVKVLLLGQDPYHGPNQAMGMAFSVPRGVSIPPSLVNMYKELKMDIPGFKVPSHGNLEGWARQGVLLLNTVLTVTKANANSHQGKGWETFTDHIIRLVNDRCDGVVFILWGSNAHKKIPLINTKKHYILKGVHPSPLSAQKGFFGCKHFSKTNDILKQTNRTPIDWSDLDPAPTPTPTPTTNPETNAVAT